MTAGAARTAAMPRAIRRAPAAPECRPSERILIAPGGVESAGREMICWVCRLEFSPDPSPSPELTAEERGACDVCRPNISSIQRGLEQMPPKRVS